MWEVVFSVQNLNLLPIYTQHSLGGFLRILSLPTKAFCTYSAGNKWLLAYTQYSSGGWDVWVWFSPNLYSVKKRRLSAFTHYEYGIFLRILSTRIEILPPHPIGSNVESFLCLATLLIKYTRPGAKCSKSTRYIFSFKCTLE